MPAQRNFSNPNFGKSTVKALYFINIDDLRFVHSNKFVFR